MPTPTPTAYATRDQLFARGLRAEMLIPPARTVEGVDPDADTLRIPGNGYPTDGPLELVANAFATVPGGLNADQVYYAKPVTDSDSLIQLAETPGGDAIDINDTGAGLLTIQHQLGAIIDASLLANSGRVDEALVNYASPLTTWPPIVTTTVLQLAAWDLVGARGLLRPDFAESARFYERQAEVAEAQLKDWKDRGGVLLGFPYVNDQTPGQLEDATVTTAEADTAWTRADGRIVA